MGFGTSFRLLAGAFLLAAGLLQLPAADDTLHFLAGNKPDALAILPRPPAMATVVSIRG